MSAEPESSLSRQLRHRQHGWLFCRRQDAVLNAGDRQGTGNYNPLLPTLWVCTLTFLLSDEQSI
jgi:hypothetical protein